MEDRHLDSYTKTSSFCVENYLRLYDIFESQAFIAWLALDKTNRAFSINRFCTTMTVNLAFDIGLELCHTVSYSPELVETFDSRYYWTV